MSAFLKTIFGEAGCIAVVVIVRGAKRWYSGANIANYIFTLLRTDRQTTRYRTKFKQIEQADRERREERQTDEKPYAWRGSWKRPLLWLLGFAIAGNIVFVIVRFINHLLHAFI